MSNPVTAAAISVAAIFGAVLLWVFMYFVYRKCRKLKRWFQARREDFGNERADTPYPSDEEQMRKQREDDQRERRKRKAECEEEGRSREDRRRDKSRRKVEEWEVSGDGYENAEESHSCVVKRDKREKWDEGSGSGQEAGRVVLQPFPCVPAYVPAFMPLAQGYVPWGVPLVPGPVSFPEHALDAEIGESAGVTQNPHQPALPYTYQEEPPAPSVQYEPEVVAEPSSSQESPVAIEATQEPVRTDFIEICDEYPEFVRKDIEREKRWKQEEEERERNKAHTSSDDSSSSDSSSISSVEEVPRMHIPTATPQPVFHFPNPYWNRAGRLIPEQIPTSYPRQW
jgi:hypothetical protein